MTKIGKSTSLRQKKNWSPQEKQQDSTKKNTNMDSMINNCEENKNSGKGLQRLENIPLQNPALIPDIDYEKLASAQVTYSDTTDPKYKKPFDYGWRRELVFRATVQENSTFRLGDVYYYTPHGFRLRSMVELAQVELEKGLTLDNFSFFPEPTGVNNLWKETIRAAVFRDKESVAQIRENVRQRLKNVKRKLAVNRPRKRIKRRTKAVMTYYEAENSSDVDNDLADEMLMALRTMKTDKESGSRQDSRIVIENDDNQPIKSEVGFSPNYKIATVIKTKDYGTNLEENESNRLSGIIKEENRDIELYESDESKFQEPREESDTNLLSQMVIKKEKDNTESQECRKEQESNRQLELIIANVQSQSQQCHELNSPLGIIIKKEKDETQLQNCGKESNTLTELEKKGGGNSQILQNLPEECSSDEQQKKNKTVSNCNKEVQTLPLDNCNDQTMLIDRLQMENMFLKEKLADLEKLLYSSQTNTASVSKNYSNDSSSSGNVVTNKDNEAMESDSDCEVICVDQVVMNMEYESVDLDSD